MTQTISELVDLELDNEKRDSVITSLCKDTEAQVHWRNYHLIGNVIRDEVSVAGSDLGKRIAKSLDSEPTVLSPNRVRIEQPAKDLWKPVAMFAVAASMALVAVVTLNPLNNGLPSNNSQTIVSTANEKDLFAQEFGEMLVEHGEFTASPGLNGLVAYAKLVSAQSLNQ